MRPLAAVLLLFLGTTTFAGDASDRSCTHERLRVSEIDRDEPMPVFPRYTPSEQTSDGVRAVLPVMEVVVARIGPDGQLVLACVDGPAAAQRFFQAPPEKLAAPGAKEK